MRILFISGELIGSAIVHQLIREGHEVKMYIEHADRKACFEGIVEKVNDWEAELDWVGHDGLIIFDDVIFEGAQERLRATGFSVIGGDSNSDKLELDRQFFHYTLQEHEIKTLPSYNFDTPEDAIDFVKQNRGQWVLKQSSHIGTLNYVGQRDDAQDMLSMLDLYKERNISPVHLQKKAIGIEVGVARYFNGNDWVGPIEINIEHKPLFNGNVGPLTAEMGTVMWYEENEEVRLFKETLAKLKPYLKTINYKGDIDIGCIVDQDNVWPLEATTRFGTPSTELQCELHESPWGEFLKAVADGEQYNLKYNSGYGVVVSVAVPPFPFGPEVFKDTSIRTYQGTSVFFRESLTDEEREHIHFEEVSKQTNDDSEHFYLAGKHGYALYVTGHGDTVNEAQTKTYGIVEKITIPDMFYRTDIGNKFIKEDRELLTDWGWI